MVVGLVMLLASIAGAGCGGPDRNARSPASDPQRPSPAHEAPAEPADKSNGRAPVACGKLTCGADQYCEIKCTCCGMRIADPSEASASYACLPLPPECASTSDGPCGGKRITEVPCA
jgi:hypothetical protein